MHDDLRFAFRSLRRQPALAAAIVVTVGLAVAANTALFSVFDGLLFRPLSYPDVDRLVHVEIPNDVRRLMSPQELRELNTTLQESAVFDERAHAMAVPLLEDGAAGVAAWGLRPVQVSPNLLELLGVQPVAGRVLTADAGRELPVGILPVMIGFDLWRARFGSDPDIVGRDVDVPGLRPGVRLHVVGVAPRGFAYPDGANLWRMSAAVGSTFSLARLAGGVGVEQARGALPGVVITPLREHVRPDGAPALGMLLAATALLLLVAWVQVAALLFARAMARSSELGVRLALGAGRLRLVRQFAVEGLLVAGAALAVAWIAAPGLTTAIVGLLPEEVTRGQLLAPDSRTFLFSVAISIAGVLLLTLVPIEIVRRSTPLALLRGGALGGTATGPIRTRAALLVAQLAVTTTLVYMSGLAVHSFAAIGTVDLGFAPEDVVAVQMPPVTVVSGPGVDVRAGIDRQMAQWAETPRALLALPGVRSVALGPLPFHSTVWFSRDRQAVSVPGGETPILAVSSTITREYIGVMGLRMVDGRLPDVAEIAAAPYALVTAALARELDVHGPVIGQRVTVANRESVVAGVVADFTLTRPDLPPEPHLLRLAAAPQGSGFIVAKIEPDVRAGTIGEAMRAALDRVWPENASREVMVLSDFATRAVADYRARAVLLALIGVLSLPLAFAGIAGALTDAAAQREREIGIRLALGAQPRDIRRGVLAHGFTVVALGVVAGLAGGVAIGRAMSAFLFGVAAADGAAMAAAAGVLAGVAWLALLGPARRAAGVSPADVLRG